MLAQISMCVSNEYIVFGLRYYYSRYVNPISVLHGWIENKIPYKSTSWHDYISNGLWKYQEVKWKVEHKLETREHKNAKKTSRNFPFIRILVFFIGVREK